jgi:hypothetical protein
MEKLINLDRKVTMNYIKNGDGYVPFANNYYLKAIKQRRELKEDDVKISSSQSKDAFIPFQLERDNLGRLRVNSNLSLKSNNYIK